jgi:hypothetical protein
LSARAAADVLRSQRNGAAQNRGIGLAVHLNLPSLSQWSGTRTVWHRKPGALAKHMRLPRRMNMLL